MIWSFTFLGLILLSTSSLGDSPTSGASSKLKPTLTAYDQRQTGKFNFNLNIKDVQLISLRGDQFNAVGDEEVYEYGDYDYNPGDFTVSPILALLGVNNATSNTTAKPATNSTTPSEVVEITSKPPTTKAPIIIQPAGSSGNATGALEADEVVPISTVKVVVPSVKKGVKRRVKNKPPFRLRAVYRRPGKQQSVPRKVTNEYVIEGPVNKRPDVLKDPEDYDFGEELEELELEDEDEEYGPAPNNNKKQKKKRRKQKKKKKKRPYPPPPYDLEDDDDPYYYYSRPPYRPGYVEYEYVDEEDGELDVLGLKDSKLEDILGVYSLVNLIKRRAGREE